MSSALPASSDRRYRLIGMVVVIFSGAAIMVDFVSVSQ